LIENPSRETNERQVDSRRAREQVVNEQWQKYESYLNCISSERRETAKAFIEYLAASQLSPKTIENYLKALRSLESRGKPYTEITRQDLMRWSNELGSRVAPGTANLYRVCIKRFYKWLLIDDEDNEVYPEIVKWIKRARSRSNYGGIVLNKEQVLAMIQVADNQRDRALLFTLYESGARASELISLKIKDVTLDQYGAIIRVRGKTGERRIRLIESVPDLRLWLEMHPDARDSETKLWISAKQPRNGLTYIGLHQLVKKYAKRIGLDGEISAHTFRHSRATHLASVLTEAQMKEIFGWTRGSDMPACYVHLSGRDVDQAILKLHGIENEERKQDEELLKPKTCPRCKTTNSPTAKFCQQCSLALDIKTAIDLERASSQADDITAKVLEYLIKKMPSLVAEAIIATNTQRDLSIVSKVGNESAKGMGSLL
jgi:site-specific recombinase XerD/ribosomal protein L40E